MSTCKSTSNISVFELQNKFSKGQWAPPLWQRHDAWDAQKKKNFEEVIIKKSEKGDDVLPGCIIVYNTKDNLTAPKKISDGYQRTLNSCNLYEKLKNLLGEAKAEELLSRISFTCHLMEYENEEEAKNDFLIINNGTSLTKAEQTKTILTSLENYPLWDQEVFSKITEFFIKSVGFLRIRERKTPNARSITLRQNLSLFYRFLINDKSINVYNFDISKITSHSQKNQILEQQIINKFNELGITKIKENIKLFDEFLTSRTSLLQHIWDNIDKSSWKSTNQSMKPATFRLLISILIFAKNTEIPIAQQQEFSKRFLIKGTGNPVFRNHNGEPTFLNANSINSLGLIEKELEYTIHKKNESGKNRKHMDNSQMMPGYDVSHAEAVSQSYNL